MKLDLARGLDVVDLSHSFTRDMPNFPSAPAYNLIPYHRLGDFELPDGYWGCNELVTMSGHSGTHLDALGHVAQNGYSHGGIQALQAQSGIDGLVKNGIEEVEPFLRRGVILDVAKLLKVEALDGATSIGSTLLKRSAAQAGVTLGESDCVVVRTGWERYWSLDPVRYIGATSGLPGIDLEGASWLADQGVSLIGSDTGVVEVTSPESFSLPVHIETLVNRGIHLLENMSLQELCQRNEAEFVFICTPLKLKGSSGSPVRPIAVFQSAS